MQNTEHRIRNRWTSKRIHTSPAPISAQEIESALLGVNQVHDALCAPPVQRIGAIEVATSIVPTRHVSGDFILSFEKKGSWYLVLGDLMGKGLAAAMWLTHVVDLIHRACEREDTLSTTMGRLNYEMHRSRVGVPLTALFLAKLEPGESRITYSCGGCPAAFLIGEDQNVMLLDRGGPVVGALEQAAYVSETITLAPGQLLLTVSDGITEVHHGAKFEMRPDRVVRHLQYTAGQSAESISSTMDSGQSWRMSSSLVSRRP
jgi:sigma-B regulation protein RsbU (phosphoserine phosphatase)